jgi:glycolate oxidase subunit GlcD
MQDTIPLFREVVGEDNVITSRIDCTAYARDMTPYFARPEAVVFPITKEHVVELVKICASKNIFITPRGGGASFQGSSLPVRGGIILDLSRMNRIIEISNEDMVAVVEPGVRYETFDRELMKYGLAFPHDVGSHDAASIGGILASDSNGHHAYKHGRVSSWIQGLEVVLSDGSVIELGTRAPRYNMGYNLSALFSGSEGTLGIITKAILRLIPRPPVEATIGAFFKDIDDLMKASLEITMSGVNAGTLEMTDGYSVKTISDIMNLGFPECEGNFVGDVQGFDEEDLQHRLKIMERILKENGGEHVIIAHDPETIDLLWAPRLQIDVAIMKSNPGYREFGFAAADPCVPLSKVAEAVRTIGQIIRSYGIIAAVFSHTGIGIIHPAVLIDPNNKKHWIAMKKAENEILEYVKSIGGVVTAEHGFGYVKNTYVRDAIGSEVLEINRQLKQLLDPQGILNPGKMGLDTDTRDEKVRYVFPEYVTDNEILE